MRKYFSVLSKSELFSGLSTEEIEKLAACLSPSEKQYQKGGFIFRAGEEISSAGFVLRGSVHVLKEDFWGNRTIIAEISAGHIFGEAYACAGPGKGSVSAVAAQDTTVLFLNIPRILTQCTAACGMHARLIQNLVTVLAGKNIVLTDKIDYMSRRRLRDKILSYLSDAAKKQGGAEFSIPFNRQELADYLSVDRSALSNELCKLRDENILEFKKNHFRFL